MFLIIILSLRDRIEMLKNWLVGGIHVFCCIGNRIKERPCHRGRYGILLRSLVLPL